MPSSIEVRLAATLAGEVLGSPTTEGLLVRAAIGFASRLRASTPKRTGQTAAGTGVESGHDTATGSVFARVYQAGHGALAEQFGNSHENTPARQFDVARGA